MDTLVRVIFALIVLGFIGYFVFMAVIAIKRIQLDRQTKSNNYLERHHNDLTETDSIYTKVVGVTFGNIQSVLPTLSAGMRLKFRREPDNEYDSNAICVICNSKKIGHLSADLACDLAPVMDNGGRLEGKIVEITGGGTKNYGCNIEVFVFRR